MRELSGKKLEFYFLHILKVIELEDKLLTAGVERSPSTTLVPYHYWPTWNTKL